MKKKTDFIPAPAPKKEEPKKDDKKKSEDENEEVTPWDGLFSIFSFFLPDKKNDKEKADLSKGVPPDSGVEKVSVLRNERNSFANGIWWIRF